MDLEEVETKKLRWGHIDRSDETEDIGFLNSVEPPLLEEAPVHCVWR